MSAPAPEASAELVWVDVEARQPSGALVGRIAGGGRVLAGPCDPCGQCEVCRRGGAAVCPSARPREHAARVHAFSRWLVPLGDGLDLPSPAAAAVAGDVTCAYTLYARTNLAPREPAVVTGATAVARFLVQILRAKGITPTVVAPPGRWHDELAAMGAAIASPDGDVRAQVAEAIAAQGVGARPWRVLACDDVALAAALTGPRATLTVLADRPVPDLPGELARREVTVIGVAGPHPDLIVEAAALCAKGDVDLAAGVTGDPSDPTRALVEPVA